MKNDYCVYALLNQYKNDSIFYIGKGKKRRPKMHYLPSSLKDDSHKSRVILDYRSKGYQDKFVVILENLTELQAFEEEIKLIALYKRRCDGGILTNVTLGGEGPSGHTFKMTEESKAKISKAKKGIAPSKQAIDAATLAKSGKPLSEAHKQKLRLVLTGRKMSDEAIEKTRSKLKGRKLSEEAKEKALLGLQKANDRERGKVWEVTYPDGNIEIVKNINKFCKENSLDSSKVSLVAANKRSHHKEYKFKILDHSGEAPGKQTKE